MTSAITDVATAVRRSKERFSEIADGDNLLNELRQAAEDVGCDPDIIDRVIELTYQSLTGMRLPE